MPKPLIMVRDKHIIDLAMESINTEDCNIIFAVRLEHINNFSIDDILREKFGNDIEIVVIDRVTDGSVSTCLLAKEHINNDLPLIIYTPDVYFQNQFDPNSISNDLDGFLLTFNSLICFDENDRNRTAKKEVIVETQQLVYTIIKHVVDSEEMTIKKKMNFIFALCITL